MPSNNRHKKKSSGSKANNNACTNNSTISVSRDVSLEANGRCDGIHYTEDITSDPQNGDNTPQPRNKQHKQQHKQPHQQTQQQTQQQKYQRQHGYIITEKRRPEQLIIGENGDDPQDQKLQQKHHQRFQRRQEIIPSTLDLLKSSRTSKMHQAKQSPAPQLDLPEHGRLGGQREVDSAQKLQPGFFRRMISPMCERPENHSRLAPPTQHPGELGPRRASNSSLDSLAHPNTRRRGSLRRGSSSRSLDTLADDDDGAATIMTYVHGAGHAYRRMRRSLRRLVQTVFVAQPSQPKVVCEAEIIEQTGWVCKDYIVDRLSSKDMMSSKTNITAANWPMSRHVIIACQYMEAVYPRVYSNLCRKLCITMSSPSIVHNTFLLFLEVLFERGITWAKLLSMLCVAGLYADECVSQGHPDYVEDVVGIVVDFTGGHLLPWLVQHGGWDCFPLPESDERKRLSKLRLLCVAGGVTSLVLLRYYLQTLEYI